jgi:hypothetical protein
MTFDDFKATIASGTAPAGITGPLLALWHDAAGDWDAAHHVAQEASGVDAAWVHAYLHRKEGDASNAAYWYRQANQPVARGDLDAEWSQIVAALLARTP